MTANDRGSGRGEPAGSLRWTVAGVVAVTVVAVWPGDPRAAALLLAGVLATCAVLRALLPEPSPMALKVRSRALDVALLGGLAVALAVLAVLLPH